MESMEELTKMTLDHYERAGNDILLYSLMFGLLIGLKIILEV